ncbi:MAG: DUF72 domain-containing protein [Rhizomicrobium sp.]
MLRIGTAGWAIRREYQNSFVSEGSHLARYARVFNAVEINSSFYRPHRVSTYTRWAEETPKSFSFAVKMPRSITHNARLRDTGDLLHAFFSECTALKKKLGCVLIQLPPSLTFEAKIARTFFESLRKNYEGRTALEPRHPSWFAKSADALLVRFEIARVAADPAPASMKDSVAASMPGGWNGFEYWRLHGHPKIYYSDYDPHFLEALVKRVSPDAWVIFDNTALGHATMNARDLAARMQR